MTLFHNNLFTRGYVMLCYAAEGESFRLITSQYYVNAHIYFHWYFTFRAERRFISCIGNGQSKMNAV